MMNLQDLQQENGKLLMIKITEYGERNENDSSIRFETKVVKSSLCDYSDAYILVTGDLKVTGGDENANVAFKNCAPLTRCVTHINNKHIDTAENIDIITPIYNLIKYSDNFSDTSGSLWRFKRDESSMNNDRNPINVTICHSSLFRYKSSILGIPADDGVLRNAKIVVTLKYLSNFWRSLEMPLINCKFRLELNWTKNCEMSDNSGEKTFKITNTKLYVSIFTLSTEYNVKLTKQLTERFKRPVYWNEYKTKIESKEADANLTRFYLDASFQGVKKLFVLAFNNTTVSAANNPINNINNKVVRDSHRKYFLPRVDITNYKNYRNYRNYNYGNFYDKVINDQIKKYEEARKIATGKGDDYTGCLLDYQYFKDQYQLIAVALSKQKELDADPKAIQKIEFYGMLKTNSQVRTIFEKSKEKVLEFYKGTAKDL